MLAPYVASEELKELYGCDYVVGYHYKKKMILTKHKVIPPVVDMVVFITPPRPESNLRYIRVATNGTEEHIKSSRISLLAPEYIHCSDDPTPEWILNDKEKLMLMEVLRENWDMMVKQYEFQTEAIYCQAVSIRDLTMPDYTQLK